MINSSTGDIVNSYNYSPFGKLINEVESVENPFKFSSEYADTETNLVYYNYRYYNPKLGRWTKRDPIAEYGGVNIYGFVGNNSINYVDYFGLAGTKTICPPKKECSPKKIEECQKAWERLKRLGNKLKKEWAKYNPIKDATGGYPKSGGGVTVPGGHYIKMVDFIEGINNIRKILSQCLKCKNFPEGKTKIPKWIRNLANKPIPKPDVKGLPKQPKVGPDPVRPVITIPEITNPYEGMSTGGRIGMVAVGVGIVLFDIITIPSGEGLLAVPIFIKAFGG